MPDTALPAAPVPPTSDDALVAAMLAGDGSAYEQVARAHSPRMLAAARRLLRNEEDARDAVQEAFLSAWKGLSGFHAGARLGTWLHRIVVNAALMRLRSRACRKEAAITDLLPRFVDDGHQLEPQTPWRDCADAAMLSSEDCRMVRQAIDRLPDTYRTILLLRDIDGLDTTQVAQLLEISNNAVKIRLHRARQALRALLEPHFVVVP